MARGGQSKKRDDPERKCIATGEVQPKAGLIRFVIGPDNQVVPDVLEKLPGRGIWVSAERSALDLAMSKNLFSRSAKMQVTVADSLIEDVDRQLSARVVNLISLARKAGLAVCGFEKVKSALANENVRCLVQASDGSERGKTKLWTPEGARYFGILTSQELGLAFGRQNVIHGALTYGGLSNRVVEEAIKLKNVREFDGGSATGKGKTTK